MLTSSLIRWTSFSLELVNLCSLILFGNFIQLKIGEFLKRMAHSCGSKKLIKYKQLFIDNKNNIIIKEKLINMLKKHMKTFKETRA
jgi:hypothetical protein